MIYYDLHTRYVLLVNECVAFTHTQQTEYEYEVEIISFKLVKKKTEEIEQKIYKTLSKLRQYDCFIYYKQIYSARLPFSARNAKKTTQKTKWFMEKTENSM